MSRAEFLRWGTFYMLYPFDDFARYHRPAALIAQSLGGGDIQWRLDWLFPEQGTERMPDADAVTMRTFGFKRKGG